MKKHLFFLIVIPLFFAIIPPSATASMVWVDPYNLLDNFTTDPPYQRNILIHFEEDPDIIEYQGYDDEDLLGGDFFDFDFEGDWGIDEGYFWLEAEEESGLQYGYADMELANWDNDNPTKRVYFETSLYTNIPLVDLSWQIFPYIYFPDGYELQDAIFGFKNYGYDPTSELYNILAFGYGVIEPNPYGEGISLEFYLEEGDYVAVDYVHIATECVPITSSAILLGSGLFGLLVIGYRRRSAQE